MKKTVLCVLIGSMVGVASLSAQSTSGFSGSNFGIQVDMNSLMGDSNVPMVGAGPSYYPQSSQQGMLLGVGFSYGFQFGSDANKFQHWALVPVLGFRTGSKTDSQQMSSVSILAGTLANATISRTTKTTEFFLSAPLRYYFQEKGQLGDGFFAEAGIVLAHSQQSVDLKVTGDYAGATQTYPYSIDFTKNRGGYVIGVGDSLPIGNHGLDLGVEYLSLPSSDPLPAHSLRVYVQWYF